MPISSGSSSQYHLAKLVTPFSTNMRQKKKSQLSSSNINLTAIPFTLQPAIAERRSTGTALAGFSLERFCEFSENFCSFYVLHCIFLLNFSNSLLDRSFHPIICVLHYLRMAYRYLHCLLRVAPNVYAILSVVSGTLYDFSATADLLNYRRRIRFELDSDEFNLVDQVSLFVSISRNISLC